MHVGRLPPGDAGGDGALGLGELAVEPRGGPDVGVGERVQPPFAVADLGQRSGCMGLRGVAVAAREGDERAPEGDHGGHVRQAAEVPADGRLERFVGRFVGGVGERPLGGVEEAVDVLHAREACPGDQQPWPGVDRPSWQGSEPSLEGDSLAAEEEFVRVPLDQLRRPRSVGGGQRVADRLLDEPVLVVPQTGVAVQVRPRRAAAAGGGPGAGRRTGGGSSAG